MPNMSTDVIVKTAAQVAPGDDDAESPNGSFHVILSTPDEDRDGEEVKSNEWELPLPARIPFDIDHGMSVATTVGSGVPTIEDDGTLHVRGTYASTPLAQQTRALVREGHIGSTSVAFLRKTQSDAKSGERVTRRELLNGAFVAIPANKEALVLSSKEATAIKVGARNSALDAEHLQGAHDHLVAAGAICGPAASSDGKSVAARSTKDAGDADEDPSALAQAVDAALDEALSLIADTDITGLPEEVRQAIALVVSAAATVDTLLDVLGIEDPDEDATADGTAADSTAATADAAAAADSTALARSVRAAAFEGLALINHPEGN